MTESEYLFHHISIFFPVLLLSLLYLNSLNINIILFLLQRAMTGSEHLFHQAAQMETRLQGHMQRRMRGMDDYMTLIRLKWVVVFKEDRLQNPV